MFLVAYFNSRKVYNLKYLPNVTFHIILVQKGCLLNTLLHSNEGFPTLKNGKETR